MTKGRFGIHGGQYIPETLMNAVLELEKAYDFYKNDPEFNQELTALLNDYAGRPSRLYYAKRMTENLGGAKIYLKREDLNHTGAHKVNNALGQCLLAKKMGKTRVIAETGAGQHGVATATAAALMGLECEIYMGKEDTIRQALNVYKMRLLGAKVHEVESGKIKEAFAGGKAFIPFITCGDPDLETTEKIIEAMAESGADLIELGIPFSDPTAEGTVIQEGNLRALSGGVTTDKVFDMVRRVRQKVKIPMVFMTYANVVFSYGTERFLTKAAEVGIDGLILPDVPYEEKAEFAPQCEAAGLDLISMIAPTSHDRIKMIAAEAKGFVYCVSSLGVTGVRSEITTDIGAMVRLVKEANPDVSCAVGFGISTPEQAAKMAAVSDGAIVGSAIVRLCAKYGCDAVKPIADYVHSMKEAIMQ